MSKPSELEVRKAIQLLSENCPQISEDEQIAAKFMMQNKIISNMIHSAFVDALLYSLGENVPTFTVFIDSISSRLQKEVEGN